MDLKYFLKIFLQSENDIPVFRHSGVPAFRCSGIPSFTTCPEHPITDPETLKYGNHVLLVAKLNTYSLCFPTYQSLTVNQRWDIVKQKQRCRKCLKTHHTKQCKKADGMTCDKCAKNHHWSLPYMPNTLASIPTGKINHHR